MKQIKDNIWLYVERRRGSLIKRWNYVKLEVKLDRFVLTKINSAGEN